MTPYYFPYHIKLTITLSLAELDAFLNVSFRDF